MKKLIALALSSAIVMTLPAAANARGWDHRGDWGGRYYSHHRHHGGFRHFGYVDYGFGYAYPRTVISIGYPAYGYGYSPYAYPAYYGYPSYGYAPYGYPPYSYGAYGCGNPAAGAVAGGLAGAVIGSAVSDHGGIHRTRYGYRYRNGNGAAGAIVGGILGAAVGSAATSANCY